MGLRFGPLNAAIWQTSKSSKNTGQFLDIWLRQLLNA